jgi:hypothetical protein
VTAAPAAFGPPRRRGWRGRTELWYATVTDADGTGYWLHHETIAPISGEPYAPGWVALFPTVGEPPSSGSGPNRRRRPREARGSGPERQLSAPGT